MSFWSATMVAQAAFVPPRRRHSVCEKIAAGDHMARGGEQTDGRCGSPATQPTANGHYRAIVPLQELRAAATRSTGRATDVPTLRDGGDARSWDALHVQQMHDDEAVEMMRARARAPGSPSCGTPTTTSAP